MRRVATNLALVSLSILLSGVVLSACGSSSQTRRYNRKQVQNSLSRLESPGLVIGEFSLDAKAIVDGDTVKVRGLDTSLRLLAIDTEETYKRDADRRASDSDFDTYLENKKGDGGRPAKAATPLGEDARSGQRSSLRELPRCVLSAITRKRFAALMVATSLTSSCRRTELGSTTTLRQYALA